MAGPVEFEDIAGTSLTAVTVRIGIAVCDGKTQSPASN